MGDKIIRGRKAQVTIFVILAILIVAAIVLLFLLFQRGSLTFSPDNINQPDDFIETCLAEKIEEALDKMFSNSGYIDLPKRTKSYLGREVPYLCYTQDASKSCVPAEPVFIEHLEDELHDALEDDVANCIQALRTNLESQGYQIDITNAEDFSVSFIPDRVSVNLNARIFGSSSNSELEFEGFETVVLTPMYEIGVIVHKIIREESTLCNSDYITMMRVDPWVSIVKDQTGDDEKVYTVTDQVTEKSMQFALRNCVQPLP